MMAAIRAADLGQDVALIEKNSSLAKKLLLSGKGRCNLTNACALELFLERFSSSGQFLRDAFKKFFNQELIAFFETRGLKLKTERQMRVFPASDSSDSIVQVLKEELRRKKVNILYKSQMKDVVIQGARARGLLLSDGSFIPAGRIILATGGVSYKFTGSTGEGIEIAKRLGHVVVPLKPGLVPLKVRQGYPKALEGLTLKNIRITFVRALPSGSRVSAGQKQIVSEIGELLFTGFGISGPLVLSLSSRVTDWLLAGSGVYAEIDLKPALSIEQLNARLLREFKSNSKKAIGNILKNLLPQRLVAIFLDVVKINLEKRASHITQEERLSLVRMLKAFRLDILKPLSIEEAMVTRGGVSLKEINPRTMESRRVKGLYFCGEMIDVDADTGGFNLQAAFSTGYLAGESAAS